MTRQLVGPILAIFSFALPAPAQTPRIDVSAGYSYLASSRTGSQGLHGGNTSLAVGVTDWFGIAADFSGHGGSLPTFGLVPTATTRLFMFAAGPRFTYRGNARFRPYGQALFGVVHQSADVTFPPLGTISVSTNHFATLLGGGLDIEVSERVAVRLPDVNFLIYSPGRATSRLRIGAGIVFRFGKK